mgnify:CR=1 FL=1
MKVVGYSQPLPPKPQAQEQKNDKPKDGGKKAAADGKTPATGVEKSADKPKDGGKK